MFPCPRNSQPDVETEDSGLKSSKPSASAFARSRAESTAAVPAATSSPTTGFLHRLLGCLYLSLLAPQDDFRTRLLKLMCVVSLLCSPYSLGVAIYFLLTRGPGNEDVGSIVWACGGTLATVAWIMLWLFVRTTRRMTNVTADLGVAAFNFALTLAVVGTTESPLEFAGCLSGVLAAIVGTPLFPVHLLWSSLIMFMQMFNVTYSRTQSWVFMVSNPRKGNPLEQILILACGVIAAAMLAIGIRLGSSMVVKYGQAAQDTVEMTRIAAQKLNKYDTDGVREVLALYEARNVISPELMSSFRQLVEQLERYRPHLPAWVLQEECEEDGPVAESTAASSVNCPAAAGPAMHRPSVRPTPASEDLESSDSSSDAGALQRSNAINLRRQRLSFASVHFTVESRAQALAVASHELTSLVDALHEWASATHGAIHSLMGDVAAVSWNAISRTAQPEANACRFMCRLARYCGREIRAGGAVFTCDAVVGMAGTKQMLPTMERPAFEAAQHYAAALGRQHSVMMACSRTMATASLVIDGYPVEVLASGPDESGKRSEWVLSVVEGEKVQEDDEWMYTLQKQCDEAPSAIVSQALKAVTERKDFGKAAQLLNALPPTYVAARPLLAGLRDRVELCLRGTSTSCVVDLDSTLAPKVLNVSTPQKLASSQR